MAKFDASKAVEALDYDFTAFGGGVGVIPEPTSGQVEGFFNTIKQLAKEVKAKQGSLEAVNEVDAADTLAEMDDNFMSEYEAEMSEAIAELCSGTPNADEVNRLPFRVRTAFIQWLVGELRPEGTRPATSR